MDDMFKNVTLSTPNYDSLLIGWNDLTLQPNITFNGGNSKYCSVAATNARSNMINNDGWTISDGGTCTIPSCTNLSSPLDQSTDVLIEADLFWSVSTYAEGYKLTVGTSSGGSDIMNNVDVGNVTTYDPGDFPYDSTIYVSILPYNTAGDAVGCTEESFTTAAWTCGDSIVYEGQSYATVQIGNQCWLAENLNVGTMINGGSNQTSGNGIEKYCYDNNTLKCDTFGGLYQWDEMMQYSTTESTQGICPTDWHLPSDDEYKTLEMQLGMTQAQADATGWRGTDEGSQLAGNEPLWTDGALDQNANFGTIGFVALPGGIRSTNGQFNYHSNNVYFWSSSESGGAVWSRSLSYDNPNIFRGSYAMAYGFSARCVKDTTPIPPCTSLTDPIDGATGVDVTTDLVWAVATGATGYKLIVGTSSGGTDILDSLDVGNVTTYDPGDFSCGSTIYVKIIPYNIEGDATGCTEESFDTEIVNAFAGTDKTITYGNSTTLSASGGLTYAWSPSSGLSNPNISNPVANPTATTTYTVTVSNDGRCPDTDNMLLKVLPPSTNLTNPLHQSTNVNITTDLSWSAASIATGYRLTVGTSSGGTDIMNDVDVGNVTTYDPGDFPCGSTIYVKIIPYNVDGDATGCTEEWFDTESITANAGSDVSICNGYSEVLQASGGTTYSWSPTTGLSDPNIANPTANPSSTTSYIVTVSNDGRCPDTDDILVNVNPNPTANASATDETAENANDGTATANPSDGTTPYTYEWSNTQITQMINNLAPGYYTVTVTDANNCTDQKTVQVKEFGVINDTRISISTDGSLPDSSSILDIKSLNKGVLIPRLSQTEIESISNPANSLLLFNTTDNRLYAYIASVDKWKEIEIGTSGFDPWVCGDVLSYEGQNYTTVQIGGQCWMSENLNIGSMVNNTTNQTDNSVIEKYCYDNNSSNCDTYGGLYQWNETMQYDTIEAVRGLCPEGWHIPTDEEYKTMEMQIGMSQTEADATGWRGTNEGSKWASNAALWQNGVLINDPDFNTSGFLVLPAGHRVNDNSFSGLSVNALFWSSSQSVTDVWNRSIGYYKTKIHRDTLDKNYGFSVRCLRD